MLIGYDSEGVVKFIFSDSAYLEKMYPNNTAKISNFWNNTNHGLREMFVAKIEGNIEDYRVIDGKLTYCPTTKNNTIGVETIQVKKDGIEEVK